MDEPVEVSVEVDAPAEEVYALVADLPRMGEWSPECVRCTWIGGARGAEVGARFRGHNRIGNRRWVTFGTVVTADPGRELAFDIAVGPVAVAGWRYRMEPLGERRCRVTESFVERRHPVVRWATKYVSGISDRRTHNRAGMQRTLERIKADVEGRHAV